MLRAKLICSPIGKREIPFRIYVAIRLPPKPFSGSGVGASYGDEEYLKPWGSMPYPQA